MSSGVILRLFSKNGAMSGGTSVLRLLVSRTFSPLAQRSLARLQPRKPSPPVMRITKGPQMDCRESYRTINSSPTLFKR